LAPDLARKFRILADIVEAVANGRATTEDVKTALASEDLKRTEIESMTIVAKKFGFITENKEQLQATSEGLAFKRYVVAINSLTMQSEDAIPTIDRGTDLKVCITVPPMWGKEIDRKFGEVIDDTLTGQRLVAEDTHDRLFIVTPYLDVGIMQVVLKDIYAKDAELVILTSEESLMKKYAGGVNYKLQNLSAFIQARFRTGKIFFLSTEASIAHAKVWCSDKSVLVTSANVKADSATDNLEVGIYTNDPELVSTMHSLLEHILKMGGLPCLTIPP
jgi:hypothetical protein